MTRGAIPPDTNRHLRGVILVFLSAAAFATEAIFIKLAYGQGSPPIAVALGRLVVASAVLGPGFLRLTARKRIAPRVHLAVFAIGAGLNSGVMLLLLLSLQRVSASVAILCLYLYPTITAVLARPVLGERITPAKLRALGGALVGVGLVAWVPAGMGGAGGVGGTGGTTGAFAQTLIGAAFAFGAAFLNAAALVLVKRWLPSLPPLVSTGGILLWGAAAFTVAGAMGGISLAAVPRAAWVYVVGLGLISTVLAFGALYSGLALIQASQVAIIASSEPAITAVLAAVILGDRLGPPQIAGGLLVIASALLSALASH